jgi:hypothetical protein
MPFLDILYLSMLRDRPMTVDTVTLGNPVAALVLNTVLTMTKLVWQMADSSSAPLYTVYVHSAKSDVSILDVYARRPRVICQVFTLMTIACVTMLRQGVILTAPPGLLLTSSCKLSTLRISPPLQIMTQRASMGLKCLRKNSGNPFAATLFITGYWTFLAYTINPLSRAMQTYLARDI